MKKIECEFCHKVNIFSNDRMRKSGNAEIVCCEYCKRAIFVSFKGKKYYEEIKK